MIHVPSIIWGMTNRTRYTVNGETAVWVQDVWDHVNELTLRYTTLNGQGMMSVYWCGVVTTEGELVLADSDRTILCDEHGNPTSVTGIQRYFPPSVLCPAYLEVGERWWKRTEGQWAWHPGDNYPDEPLSENDRYRHDNAFYTDGVHLWHDEEFAYWRSYNGAEQWVIEYSRGFLYRVADRKLLHFTDNINNVTYARST